MGRKAVPKQDYAPRIYDWQLEQIPSDMPYHDELIYAFQQYYIANLQWIQTGTKRSAQDTRYWLNEIKLLTIEQRKCIMEWIKTINDKNNSNRNYKASTKKQRKLLQIRGMVKPSDDI